MLTRDTFERKMSDLSGSLPIRPGSDSESRTRTDTYWRILSSLHAGDFVEACDRILFSDEWFPTIARIRAVASECAHARVRSEQAVSVAADLVCPACHGARWVRYGGYDPLQMSAGNAGSRVQRCPRCTSVGKHDPALEARVIRDEGGVPNPDGARDVDLSRRTWRAPRLADGRIDVEALYRESRLLRGLDPDIDERPVSFGTWQTIGGRRDERPAPLPEPEPVAAGRGMDDVPW